MNEARDSILPTLAWFIPENPWQGGPDSNGEQSIGIFE